LPYKAIYGWGGELDAGKTKQFSSAGFGAYQKFGYPKMIHATLMKSL